MNGQHPDARRGRQISLADIVCHLDPKVKDLLRTPMASELAGGMLSPEKAREKGQMVRLTSQVVDLVDPDQLKKPLLGTPRASEGHTGIGRVGSKSHTHWLEHGYLTAQVFSVADHAMDWGKYEPAIRQWEAITGIPVPMPVKLNTRGTLKLDPKFTEWMMGLEPGWVTDPAINISEPDQVKACGNGVVPLQAEYALGTMLAEFEAEQDHSELLGVEMSATLARPMITCGYCEFGGHHESCPGGVRNGDGSIVVCKCDHEGCWAGKPRCTDCNNRDAATIGEDWRCIDRNDCQAEQDRKARLNPTYMRVLAIREDHRRTSEKPVGTDTPSDRPSRSRTPRSGGKPCVCGCEGITKGGNFLPGHDSKYLNQLVALSASESDKALDAAKEISEAFAAKLLKRVSA